MFYSWLWFCVRKFDLKGKILAFCLPHKECSYLSLFLVRFSFILLNQDFLGSLAVETLCFHCSRAQVWSLGREDSTCHRAAQPMHHSCWARAPQLLRPQDTTTEASSPCSSTREATTVRSPCTATKNSPHSPQPEEAPRSNEDPSTGQNQVLMTFYGGKEVAAWADPWEIDPDVMLRQKGYSLTSQPSVEKSG